MRLRKPANVSQVRAVIPSRMRADQLRAMPSLAASPGSCFPSQAGSSHPPVAYRAARLPVSPSQAA